jgi:hypothetical protein
MAVRNRFERSLRSEQNNVITTDEEAAHLAKHIGEGDFLVGHDLANGDRSVQQEHVPWKVPRTIPKAADSVTP